MPTDTNRLDQERQVGVEVRAAFRVMGPNLDPAEISRLLELEPTESHRRGDPRFGKSGQRYSDFSEGLWGWRPALSDNEPFAEHLDALLNVLEPKAAVLQQLRDLDLRLDFFVGVFGSEGNFVLVLEHTLMKRLGALGVDLVFDVYCY